MGNTHLDALWVSMLQNPFQILQNQWIFLPRIGQIDCRIQVFDVDDVAIQDFVHLLNGLKGHVEAGLDHNLPLRSTNRTEFLDEILLKQGFSPTKGDAAMRGQKIELIDLDLFKKQLRGVVTAFVHVP